MRDITPFNRPSPHAKDVSDITSSTIQALFKSFLSSFSGSSRVTMRYALRMVANSLGMSEDRPVDELPWHTLTASAVEDVKETLNSSGLSPRTVRLYLQAVRALCRAMYIRGLMRGDDYQLIKEVKMPKGRNRVGRGRAVENKYRDKLIENCIRDERIQGVRDAALIAMFFGSGMRRAEVVSIKCEDLNLNEGEVKVVVKGGDTVFKYLTGWSIPYIRQWVEVRNAKLKNPKGPLFSRIIKSGKVQEAAITGRGAYYLLRERSLSAGLPFIVKPHDARRTMGTLIIAEHGDIIAQRVLGHANLATTAIYDKRSDDVIKTIFRDK